MRERPKLNGGYTSRWCTYRGIVIEVKQNHVDYQEDFFCVYVTVDDWMLCNIRDIRTFSEFTMENCPDIFEDRQCVTYVKREEGSTKIGCDYNHSWHHERGNFGDWDTCLFHGMCAVDWLHWHYRLRVHDWRSGELALECAYDSGLDCLLPNNALGRGREQE